MTRVQDLCQTLWYRGKKTVLRAMQSMESVKGKVLVAQSCLILCNLMDCSPLGSSVHEILQARILDWVAIPFSSGSSLSRD